MESSDIEKIVIENFNQDVTSKLYFYLYFLYIYVLCLLQLFNKC